MKEIIENDTKALVEVKNLDMAVLFSKSGLEKILASVEQKAMAHIPNVSTEQGRKDIASLAHKIARSKTLIDDLGKDRISEAKKIVDEVNGYRKYARDFLDALKNKVRQPLTDYEADEALKKEAADRKERERIEGHITALSAINKHLPFFEVAGWTDDEFDQAFLTADNEYRADQKRLADEEAARKAETERLEKIRKEQEAEAIRLTNEKRKIEEAQAAEREKIEAERRVLEAEKKSFGQAALEAQVRANARMDAEKAAQEKIARETREAKEKEERETAEASRQATLLSDKEKLLVFADALMKCKNDLIPELKYGSLAYPLLSKCEMAVDKAIKTLIKEIKLTIQQKSQMDSGGASWQL